MATELLHTACYMTREQHDELVKFSKRTGRSISKILAAGAELYLAAAKRYRNKNDELGVCVSSSHED